MNWLGYVNHRLPRLIAAGALVSGILGSVLAAPFAHAHEGHDHPPIAVQPAAVYAPKVLPDRIVLTWAGDPQTTQAVTWRTSTEVMKGLAEIAVATPGPEFAKAATQVPAASQALLTDLSTAH
jgi:hypothetical protein